MIQQTNSRQTSTSLAPLRQPQDGPEIWGQWSGRKHYSLEVVQQPLRARMCGFGDKDRRPLAPAAVAKMIVRGNDDNPVDVDDVDCSFFLVTVDLWSGDGKHEMNLVLHPSAAERHPPPHSARPKRRNGNGNPAPHTRSSANQTPRTTPTPVQYRPSEQSSHTSGYNNQAYFPPVSDQMGFSPSTSYSATHSETPTWAYNAHPPPTDRNNSFPPPPIPTFSQTNSEPETSAYRAWGAAAPYPPSNGYANSQVDPALRAPPNPDGREWSQTERYHQETYSPTTSQLDNAVYEPPPYSQQLPPSQPVQQSSHYPPHVHATPSQPAGSNSSIPRHSYTRTLVGPLSSNASRLLDEHRKPGIFFLFQDLSIRTEGTFRLRLRLMNVGAPPAPEFGATRVQNAISPVLAQTFTEPFVVYSAKRFPGVPDTTALSIAFGNQGQKLPLRNRHGSSKRRRRGDSDSGFDSDEG